MRQLSRSRRGRGLGFRHSRTRSGKVSGTIAGSQDSNQDHAVSGLDGTQRSGGSEANRRRDGYAEYEGGYANRVLIRTGLSDPQLRIA